MDGGHDAARLNASRRLFIQTASSVPRVDGAPSLTMTKNYERSPESGGIASTEGAGLAARFQALLSVAESMTSCRDPEELFRKLAAELQRIVSFDRIGVTLYDPQRRVLHTQVLDPPSMDIILRLDVAAEDTPMGWVIESQEPLIIGDVATETRWLDTITRCREEGVGSFCVLPLTTARRRVGVLGFGRYDPVMYTAADVAFLGDVAKLVAVSIENALNFDDAQAAQRQLAAERDHLRLLLDLDTRREGDSQAHAATPPMTPSTRTAPLTRWRPA